MSNDIKHILEKLEKGDVAAVSRAISIVENEISGYETILESLRFKKKSVVTGITGPPGAGKSTLINSLLHPLAASFKVAVIAVDPTSSFSHGSLLGDRLRMADHFQKQNVFIRSVATRGSLGGLSDKTFEITDVLRAAGYDYIFIETVGVGQSEIDIAWLADTTVVVLVPGTGDEVQAMKSGILEIADIFVINKADNDHTNQLYKDLVNVMHLRKETKWKIPVIKTIATQNEGVQEVISKINEHHLITNPAAKMALLSEKALRLVQHARMRSFDRAAMEKKLAASFEQTDFNLYRFVRENFS